MIMTFENLIDLQKFKLKTADEAISDYLIDCGHFEILKQPLKIEIL